MLYSVQTPVTRLGISTVFSKMPLTRPRIRVTGHRWGSQVAQFYGVARFAWQRFKVSASGRSDGGQYEAANLPAVDHRALFRWNRSVWIYLVVLLVLGGFQRLSQGHLAFDDLVFAPLFVGLPVAAARRRLGDGLWLALLGCAGLFTVKFPAGGLLGTLLLPSDGFPLLLQWLAVLVCLIVIVATSNLVQQYVSEALWFLGVLVWVPFVWWADSASAMSLLLPIQTLVAMAVAILASWRPGTVRAA
jgi:hypothetical protein